MVTYTIIAIIALSLLVVAVPLKILLSSPAGTKWRKSHRYNLNKDSSTKFRQTHFDLERNRYLGESDIYLTERNHSAIELISLGGESLHAEIQFTIIYPDRGKKQIETLERIASEVIRNEFRVLVSVLKSTDVLNDLRQIIELLERNSKEKLKCEHINLKSVRLIGKLKRAQLLSTKDLQNVQKLVKMNPSSNSNRTPE